MLKRVEGQPNLRKSSSGVVVNVASDDYDKYIRQKEMVKQEKERINALENDVSEIKDMLKQLLDRV